MKKENIPLIWHPYTIQKGSPPPLKIVKAEKEFLYDSDGNEYIDAVSSWWISIHGHNHPHIIEAVRNQLSKLDHVLLAGFTNGPAIQLANELIKMSGNDFVRVFYSDNGSCAIEIALKIAFQFFKNTGLPEKEKFVHFTGSYHGDTIGAMSIGGKSPYNSVFENLLLDSPEFISPNCTNCPLQKKPESCSEECLGGLEIYTEQNAGIIAAIILEPIIQGAGGMIFYKKEVLEKIRALCDRNNILLILDEVFTGFGRTGKNFGYDHSGIKPDIIAVAKGLSGGVLPVAATLVNERVYDAFYSEDPTKAFYHGHTMTGNPSACAAGLASIELYNKEERLKDVISLETKLKKMLTRLLSKFPGKIYGTRVLGAVAAFEIHSDEKTGYMNPSGKSIKEKCLEKKVIVRPLGNTVYLTPPYIITDASLDKIETVLINSLS